MKNSNSFRVMSDKRFGDLRVTQDARGVWFVAADVCKHFKVLCCDSVLSQIDFDDICHMQIPDEFGIQCSEMVNEFGLYAMLQVFRSYVKLDASKEQIRANEAERKAYREWVKSHVIPAMHSEAQGAMEMPMKSVKVPEAESSAIQIFSNEQFGEIRTFMINDEPWFVAADVCRALEHTNVSMALEKLDEDERAKFNLGRQGETNIVSEAGLYLLVMRSRKPEAKLFRRWIVHEVLPSIRKHGAYITSEKLEEVLLSPEMLVKLSLQLKDEYDKRRAAEDHARVLEAEYANLNGQVESMQPKAEYYDQFVTRGLTTSLRETAKELGVKESEMIDVLLTCGYLYRDGSGRLMPYADYVHDKDYFTVKECYSRSSRWCGTQTLVTPDGRNMIRTLLIRWLEAKAQRDTSNRTPICG